MDRQWHRPGWKRNQFSQLKLQNYYSARVCFPWLDQNWNPHHEKCGVKWWKKKMIWSLWFSRLGCVLNYSLCIHYYQLTTTRAHIKLYGRKKHNHVHMHTSTQQRPGKKPRPISKKRKHQSVMKGGEKKTKLKQPPTRRCLRGKQIKALYTHGSPTTLAR